MFGWVRRAVDRAGDAINRAVDRVAGGVVGAIGSIVGRGAPGDEEPVLQGDFPPIYKGGISTDHAATVDRDGADIEKELEYLFETLGDVEALSGEWERSLSLISELEMLFPATNVSDANDLPLDAEIRGNSFVTPGQIEQLENYLFEIGVDGGDDYFEVVVFHNSAGEITQVGVAFLP